MNLPTCHYFLATLYSKVLLESKLAPSRWVGGKIILLHKHSEPSFPENFIPIVLSSSIGKLFHKILALRLQKFCLSNDIIDSSIQKEFFRELMVPWNTYLHKHQSLNMPIPIAFHLLSPLLRTVFGSISHSLINGMMSISSYHPIYLYTQQICIPK